MKLILSLILLLISIVLNNAININGGGNKNLNFDTTQNCFLDNNGPFIYQEYHTTYNMVALNSNYEDPISKEIKQQSFIEYGVIDLDLKNNQIYSEFVLKSGNTTNIGYVWYFISNNTQYYIPADSNDDQCYSSPIELKFPKYYNIVYIGDITIGEVKCEMYDVSTDVSNTCTTVELIVDKAACSFMSYNSNNNADKPIAGSIMLNFYNFYNSSFPNYFNLPSACYNPTPSSKFSLKSIEHLFN